ISNNAAFVFDGAATSADVGATVTGPGIAAGSTIVSVTPGVGFVMNQPATASANNISLTITTTVTPYNPNVVTVAAPLSLSGANKGHELQAAIDAAAAGDLLVLSPGVYNEN